MLKKIRKKNWIRGKTSRNQKEKSSSKKVKGQETSHQERSMSMSRNILFEHNQKAYKAAISMMEGTGKAAVIHPTGTGKSFIGFQLCADHKKEKICWLSPSEYIYRTQREKWLLAGGEEIENLSFMTYAKLMRLGEREAAELKPSYLILDEFHRLGAAQWGRGVEVLRERYPKMKILGLSATNIRYLDNQRDMAWELFGGNVASELTLGAAIAQGILPAPKYVLSVYSYREGLCRYERRVNQTRKKAIREKAEQELEALRRALEKAEGLTEVFAKHMISKAEKTASGKYIVFCANYEHLLTMRELAPEWFAKVDATPHIYTAYSEDPMTAAEFEAFKKDESNHLKLLYCIDMLNEGIHVDGLSGVILLRPTVSPTIYKQQIGRALAAGGKNIPVIFDIVMNIENLCSIGAIEEELREAVLFCRANGRADEIIKENFQIVDELGDCRRLFTQLNETLGASWDAMYTMAKEYYEMYGNLEIPAKYATEEGYSLGAWISTQRKVYQGKTAGCLSEEQIERLSKIGMRWKSTQEAAWERNFAEAERYVREHGNLNVPADFVTENGCGLGRWIRRQREKYQNRNDPEVNHQDGKKSLQVMQSAVEKEHIQKLTEIGMIWESVDSWERRFALAKRYYKEHGNLEMPIDYVVEGVWLGRWLREQKIRFDGDGEYRKRELNEEQKKKLCAIGFIPGKSKIEISWREQYRYAEEFYRKYGNLSIPKHYTAKNGKKLGVWLQYQRASRKSGNLANWQIQMLDNIGMVWEISPWENGLQHAQAYFKQHGDLAVPNQYVCADGYRLGRWISNQRCAYAGVVGKRLREDQTRQLEEIGMVWNMRRGRQCGKEPEKIQGILSHWQDDFDVVV